MNQNIRIKITILATLASFIILTGFGCKFLSGEEKELLKPVRLNWWGVEGDTADYAPLIGAYRSIHPNISITYRKLRLEEFESELINALAEDRGPDIFSIRNTWVNKYLPKIKPLPPKTTLAYEISQKSLGVKQEIIIEVRDTKSITIAELENAFIDVVYKDTIKNGEIYGLPLSVDTLVLFYNKDLFNAAGIPLPPNNWAALQDNVRKLTFQNNDGDLIQSGVAIGTAENVSYSTDILSLLMLQNGAQIISGRRVTFGNPPPGSTDRKYNPGPEALTFYTDFSNPGKEVYTWNSDFPNSIDAFAQGQVAMMFGYHADIKTLEAKRQGKLNFGITNIPQIQGRPADINFSRYWINTVSNKSGNINEAWDFVQFMARKKSVKAYLDKTGKPTALRSLIAEQIENDELSIFVEQLLTAQSWYRGNNASVAESAFSEMIESVSQGADIDKAIKLSIQKIQQTL